MRIDLTNKTGSKIMKSIYCPLCCWFLMASSAQAQLDHPAPIKIPESEASSEQEMKPYSEVVEHTRNKIEMVPIPSGKFLMGSSKKEKGRADDEGPQHEIKIPPFWMGKTEITWDVYEVWMSDIDIQIRKVYGRAANERDKLADPLTISKPTAPYTDMTFGMGKRGYPAISMTQHAARTFCKWLSAKTGRYYRLPSEAEWEYACRAGTTTRYSWGDDAAKIGDYAWYYENSNDKYQKVGKKLPNPWGLYDMHGNVAEWVLDQHDTEFYGKTESGAVNPVNAPLELYPRVVRGGSWQDESELLRSAARLGSTEDWKYQDPQEPQSIWYHTDALHVGLRVVRPLVSPSKQELKEIWDKALPLQFDKDNPQE